ncbi:hypothetical protein CLF_108149 [Clonorchis sinensis]|uniref:Uncharacterized protein n=1 Tax=Clonorchis sinensis TaxID=79923 RepID=G7YHP9_CLOSI|nr:hypothetical protein CLF_108149 [Clonorchis sinensis]
MVEVTTSYRRFTVLQMAIENHVGIRRGNTKWTKYLLNALFHDGDSYVNDQRIRFMNYRTTRANRDILDLDGNLKNLIRVPEALVGYSKATRLEYHYSETALRFYSDAAGAFVDANQDSGTQHIQDNPVHNIGFVGGASQKPYDQQEADANDYMHSSHRNPRLSSVKNAVGSGDDRSMPECDADSSTHTTMMDSTDGRQLLCYLTHQCPEFGPCNRIRTRIAQIPACFDGLRLFSFVDIRGIVLERSVVLFWKVPCHGCFPSIKTGFTPSPRGFEHLNEGSLCREIEEHCTAVWTALENRPQRAPHESPGRSEPLVFQPVVGDKLLVTVSASNAEISH